MNLESLTAAVRHKRSFLSVGLDSDMEKLPAHLPRTVEGLLLFNQEIIAATAPYAVSYKINTAFYEALGTKGWAALEATARMLPTDTFAIADAKRGDIGNTSALYARAFLQELPFQAVTVSPYMGHDSVQPFLQAGKTVIVLGLTSNPGSEDIQQMTLANGRKVYEEAMHRCAEWSDPEGLMFVVGATKPEQMADLRAQFPHYWFLVPGVGAQGGDLASVAQAGLMATGGLLVNSSRAIIYASNGPDYAQAAAAEAKRLQQEMAQLLEGAGILS